MHLVIEGPESSGKGSITKVLAERYNGIVYGHPGATSLGKELRVLIKNRHDITISRYTEQVLMMADYCEFIEQILKKNKDKLIISDRSNIISGLIYGYAGGVSKEVLEMLVKIVLALDMPKMHLIILHAPYDVLIPRRHHDVIVENGIQKVVTCRIENRGSEFHKKVCNYYQLIAKNGSDELSTWFRTIIDTFSCDINYVDASAPLDDVLKETIRIIENKIMIGERHGRSSS